MRGKEKKLSVSQVPYQGIGRPNLAEENFTTPKFGIGI